MINDPQPLTYKSSGVSCSSEYLQILFSHLDISEVSIFVNVCYELDTYFAFRVLQNIYICKYT